jgi:multicomponent K+:H+ antiporter subunit A
MLPDLYTIALIIGVPFGIAAVALVLSPAWAGRVALLAPATVLVLGVPLWLRVYHPEMAPIHETVQWFPSLGMTASLMVDRLGAFFVLLIGAVGLGVVQYSRHYLGPKGKGPFWAVLLAFMGSMLGIVLSDSLILLFVFWELTTITSALLIGMDFHSAEARRGAVQAFLVTGAGGLALLAGIVLLGSTAGTYDLSALAERSDAIVADRWHWIPLGLLLLGAFTKSAQFPFHFWLPGAMSAPAPISAYLHSATMVKAGIFLLGRLFPVFSESPYWFPVLAAVGLTTFFVAGWSAVRADDLKQLLAFSTVAYLGVLTAMYGYYSVVGLKGEIVNIANHALYKSSLFLLIGWLEKTTGTREFSLLDPVQWFRRERWGGALIGLGALAMAGVPFLLGFMSKEVFFGAIAKGDVEGRLLAIAIAVLASAMAVTYSLKLFVGTFWGTHDPPPRDPARKISPWLLIVPSLLLVPQLLGGVVPQWFLGTVLEPQPAAGPDFELGFWNLAFWAHWDILLALSLAAFTLGIAGFMLRGSIARLPHFAGSRSFFDALANGTLAFATWLSRAVQSGGHPRFLSVILVFAVGAMVAGVWMVDPPDARAFGVVGPDAWLAWLPAAAISVGALMTVIVRGRIPKVIMMAVVGYGMAVYYVLFRAPDLALTQLLVETVSLILLLLIFRRMPPMLRDSRPPSQRVAHAAVAVVVGLGTGALAWMAGAHAARDPAGAEQLALSQPVAKGDNVVNVILVDFRGMDTLGEVAVLAIAALGAVALFRAGREPGRGGEDAR